MATLIIGHGAILNAPIVLEKVSEQASSRREEPLSANALAARYLELNERGNLYWWRRDREFRPPFPDGATELAAQVLKSGKYSGRPRK